MRLAPATLPVTRVFQKGDFLRQYSFHIGDFDKATRHLSRIERSVYRDLIDMYYDTEHPLPTDLEHINRKIVARSNEESTAVQQVLNEFFTETPAGWFHARCDEVIHAYQTNTSQKAQAGKASAASKALRKAKMFNGCSTAVEQPLISVATEFNVASQPITINHKPKRESAKPLARPEDVPEQIWSDWVSLRKAKNSSVTETVIRAARKEAGLARLQLHEFLELWCLRGTMGFQASWIRTNENPAKNAIVAAWDGAR